MLLLLKLIAGKVLYVLFPVSRSVGGKQKRGRLKLYW